MASYEQEILEDPKFKDLSITSLENYYLSNIDKENLNIIIKEKLSDIRKEIAEYLRIDNVCFLTGNGSSIYAGSTDTKSFNCEDYFDEKKLEEKNILNTVKDSSIEKVLNNLITLYNYYDLKKYSRKKSKIIKKIKEIENDFIKNNVEAINYDGLIYHEMLLRKLKAMNVINKTTFFTLNYDLAFEYTLDKLQIQYKNGFTGFINRSFNGASLDKIIECPKIVKLHGSLNWYADENGFDIKESQPVFEKGKIKHTEDSYLIYPTANKFVDSQNYPFSELIRSFLNMISNKKVVLFIIGYKFEDTHINDIIKKSLMNPNIILYIFNYKANNAFLKELEKLSKIDERIKYYDETFISDFRTFSFFLLPSNNTKDDLEKIRDVLMGVKE